MPGLTLLDLPTYFGATPQWPDANLAYYLPRIAEAGLELITCVEYTGRETFTDVGALVWHLHAIPWLVQDFSAATHRAQLLELQQRWSAENYFVLPLAGI